MQAQPSVGRTVAALIVMLVVFAVVGAFFIALDNMAGVHVNASIPFLSAVTPTVTRAAGGPPASSPTGAASRATATATLTSTLSVTPSATATPDVTPIPAASATPWPTPPGGITPPRYGVQPNYLNNTSFTAAFAQSVDASIISLTNAERSKRGLSVLAENQMLDIIAAARSQDMIKRNYFDHFDPTGPLDQQGRHIAAVQELLTRNSITYSEVGENLIRNTGFPLSTATAAQVVRAWMNHPEHRANILHPSYTTIGVGLAAQNQPAGLRVVITQIFIR